MACCHPQPITGCERQAALGLSWRPVLRARCRRPRLRFRVGVHTGAAVLGLIGTESRVEYTAIGDSVNTAKRLQENAASGTILLSRQAIEPILDKVEAEQVESVQALGKRDAIEVWQLKGFARA
jgi:class 3 adenylate cyclase